MSEEALFLKTLRSWAENAMHRSMHAFFQHNRESGLSFSLVNTLFHIFHHGPASVNNLAKHLGITKAAVSQLLDHLFETGLILRMEDPDDRRAKRILLTEKGEQAVRSGIAARHAWLKSLAEKLSPSEQAQILPGLQLLLAALNQDQT
jgi:DNA-binding MarR family transcriptional regulator